MCRQLTLNSRTSHQACGGGGGGLPSYALPPDRRLSLGWPGGTQWAASSTPPGGFSFRTPGSPVSEHAQCSPCRSDQCCHGAVAPGFACDPRRGQGSAAPGTPGSVGIPRTQRSGGARRGALPWDRDRDLNWGGRGLLRATVKKVSGHLAPGSTIGP